MSTLTADFRTDFKEGFQDTQSKLTEATTPEEKHQPLGASLPHRNVDYQAGEPTLGANIAPAYMAQVPELEPSSLPRTPSVADLEATIDTSFTPAIKELANKLDKDPVKIYEFVKNNMVFEPYYGSRKGAQETLWEKGGNDVDQANLLIALFRYSDKPSRYVTGVVEIPIGAAMNWVGVEKEEVAAKVFSTAGIPSKAIVSGGKISAIQIEHTWVEAYVNYGNYRGVDNDGGPKSWVALDGSFKEMEYKKPVDLEANGTFDVQGFVDQLITSSTIDSTASSISNIDEQYIEDTLQETQKETSAYIDSNYPNASGSDLVGKRTLISEKLGLLPASLPLKTVSITSEHAAVPNSRQAILKIDMPGLSFGSGLPAIASKTVTISYVAATDEDRNVLSGYELLSEAPAYLVKVLPLLLIDGKIASIGTEPVDLGADHHVSVNLRQPGLNTANIDHIVTAGSYYGLTFDLGSIKKTTLSSDFSRLQVQAESLKAFADQTTESIELKTDDLVGQMLSKSGQVYFAQLDAANALTASAMGVVYQRDVSELMTGIGTKKDSLFGLPLAVEPAGLFFDVGGDHIYAIAEDGDQMKTTAFVTASGITGSYLEGITYPRLFGQENEGISTMSILRLASAQGMPIYTIDNTNIDTALPRLTISTTLRQEIQNAVNQGLNVTIPERPITSNGWTGMGYIVSDPNTGYAGYMISGGLAGGWWDTLQNAFSGISVLGDTVIRGILLLNASQVQEGRPPIIGTALMSAVSAVPFAAVILTFVGATDRLMKSELSPEMKAARYFVLAQATAVAAHAIEKLSLFAAIPSETGRQYYSILGIWLIGLVYTQIFGTLWPYLLELGE